MVIWILIGLGLVALVLWLVVALQHDVGYVLVTFGTTQIETNLVVLLVSALLLGLIFVVLFKVISLIYRAVSSGLSFFSQRRQRRSEARLLMPSQSQPEDLRHTDAALEMSRRLPNGRRQDLLATLLEIDHHHATGEREERTRLLRQAAIQFPKVRDELRLKEMSYEVFEGYSTVLWQQVRDYYEQRPSHPGVQLLYFQCCLEWEQYAGLKSVLGAMRRNPYVNPRELMEAELRCIEHDPEVLNAGSLRDYWKQVPRKLRGNESLVQSYVLHLHNAGRDQASIQAIEDELSMRWNARLVTMYGLLVVDRRRQTATAQEWQRKYPDEHLIGLTLARLSAGENPQESLEHYMRVVSEMPAYNVLLEASNVSSQTGDAKRSQDYWQRAQLLRLSQVLGTR